MYRILEKTQDNIIGMRVSEKLSKEDIEGLRTYLEKQIIDHGDLRLLIHMSDWNGWDSFNAMWEDLKTEIKLNKHIERIAMVGEEDFDRWMASIARPFTKGTVRYFKSKNLDQAWDWMHEESTVEA